MILAGKKLNNNSNEFKEIFNQLFPSIALLASRILNNNEEGKDIAQNIFIKIWDSKNSFENLNALRAYLYLMTKNSCIDYIRKSKNINLVELDTNENIETEKQILNEILREETYFLLRNSIKELSKQTQKIVELTLNGNSNQEIADELNITINTVKTLKYRAYKQLRKKLGYQFITILLTQFYHFLN